MDRELARVSGRTFTVEYESGVAEVERTIERKEIVSGWVNGRAAESNRDDFSTNRVTVAQYRDAHAGGEGNVQGLSTAGACVSFWAGNIAGLPLHVQRKVNGVDTPYPEHPLYWILHDSPNFDQSAFDFWEYMIESLEWRGNAYARISRRTDGNISSLTPIPPDAVRATRLANGEIGYFWQTGGRPVPIAVGDMLHIRGRGGDALGGASPLGTYRRALGLALATEASAAAIFDNGVRSSGVLRTDKALTAAQRPELETLLQEKFAGAANAGRPMLLDNGLTWEKITIDPVDAELVTSRELNMAIVCQIFEVDPHLVGITAGNTQLGSSISDQTLSLVKFKMHKRLKRIEGALGKQLLTRADRQQGVSIRFNIEGFLRADSAGRAAFYKSMTDIGAMTINEVRALEGLPSVPGGDVPRIQMQNAPITAAPQPNTGDTA